MAGIRWLKEEDDFLKENYEKMDKIDIINGLGRRSWDKKNHCFILIYTNI